MDYISSYLFTPITKAEQATESVRLFRQKKPDLLNTIINDQYDSICEQVQEYSMNGWTELPPHNIFIRLGFVNLESDDYIIVKDKLIKKLKDDGLKIEHKSEFIIVISWTDPNDSTNEEKSREECAEFENKLVSIGETVVVDAYKIAEVALQIHDIAIK